MPRPHHTAACGSVQDDAEIKAAGMDAIRIPAHVLPSASRDSHSRIGESTALRPSCFLNRLHDCICFKSRIVTLDVFGVLLYNANAI